MPEIEQLNGRRVTLFHGTQDAPETLTDTVCLYLDYDDNISFPQMWEHFKQVVDLDAVTQLIIGAWDDEVFEEGPEVMVETLVNDAANLQHLESLFVGDISGEESEISWICNGELGPLLNALPNLTYFGARGGNDLRFEKCSEHLKLQKLVIETGGLDQHTVEDIIAMNLPELKELELWLGSSDYGFSGEVDTYLPLIVGKPYPDNSYPFPKLTHLRLKNSEIADDLAHAFLDAPVLSQLKTLDLSMGIMSDQGVQALLENKEITNLSELDLSSNYIQDSSLFTQLSSKGITIHKDNQKDEGDYGRYVDVGE